MKTKKQVLTENPELKTIINAVVKRIGMESIQDVNNHGINGGFNGFIYYVDTHQFAMRHRKTIISMLENMANELGEEVVEMICNFGIFRNSPADKDDKKEIYRYLSGARCQQSSITSVMAWFAAEEICRLFEN